MGIPAFFLAQLINSLLLLAPSNSIWTPFLKNKIVGNPLILYFSADSLLFDESIFAKVIFSFFNINEALWYSGANPLQCPHHGA